MHECVHVIAQKREALQVLAATIVASTVASQSADLSVVIMYKICLSNTLSVHRHCCLV